MREVRIERNLRLALHKLPINNSIILLLCKNEWNSKEMEQAKNIIGYEY